MLWFLGFMMIDGAAICLRTQTWSLSLR